MTHLVDLHLHSNTPGSDGELPSDKLIDYICQCASRQNIPQANITISLTDHNTTTGLHLADKIAKKYEINLIPGCEIMLYDPVADLQIEMLIYASFDKINNPEIQQIITQARNAMRDKIKNLILHWRQKGFMLDGHNIKLSDELYHNLIASDINNDYVFFTGYVKPQIEKQLGIKLSNAQATEIFYEHIRDETGQLYTPFKDYPFPTPQSLLNITKKLSIISVLPHPGEYKLETTKLLNFIENLRLLGLRGVEVYTRKNSDELISLLKNYCCQYNLLMTGGSDFHSSDGGGKIGKYRLDKFIPHKSAELLTNSLKPTDFKR